jgi:cysteine-rich repeat protein
MHLRTARFLVPALAVALGACDVFDPGLYRADGGSDAGSDDGGIVAGPDMTSTVPFLALADRCNGELPTLSLSLQEFIVDTTGLSGDFTDLATCTGQEEQGNDGFFAIQMLAGQRWHFHVHPLSTDVDLALYVVPTCDERSCSVGNAEDECGAGRDEHMSFLAPTSGKYMVGIDSRKSGGGRFDVLAVRPICGDGMREHSESCDDGNLAPGDGCDARCRSELTSAAPNEVEPNDDYTGANVVMLSAATPVVTTRGRLGGRCDFDMFAIDVPAGGSIAATLLDANGAACTASAPPVLMTFILPDGHTIGGSIKGDATTPCPVIGTQQPFANNIATAGTYFVRVTPTNDLADAFDYSLRLELKPSI